MKSLSLAIFALCLSVTFLSSASADPAPSTLVGRWTSVRHRDGMEIRVVFVFGQDGTFFARSDRTSKPMTPKSGTFSVSGTWSITGGTVTIAPRSMDPPGEATLGDLVFEVVKISEVEMTIKDAENGQMQQFKKTAEPGATDNPGDAQRLREDH